MPNWKCLKALKIQGFKKFLSDTTFKLLPPLTYNKQNKMLGSEKVKNTYNLALVLDIFKFNRGISNLYITVTPDGIYMQ